jgi:hypothetical protein
MTTKNKTTTIASTTKTAPAQKRLGTRKAPSTAAAQPPVPVSATTAAAETTTTAPEDLASLVNDVMSFLDVAEPKLGPEPTVTTSTQKRRVSKPRKGADKVLPVIASIVQQHGLDSTSLSSKTVMDAYTTSQTLQPLQTRLQKMTKRVSDTAFGAQTDAWGMGLQLYSMLKRRAKTDGQVAEQIAPLAHVFSYRHPLVKAAKPTKRETKVKAEVKHVTALAERHGVPFGASASSAAASTASAGGAAVGSSGAQAPVAVQAPVVAQAPVAVQAPVVAQAPVASAPVATQAPVASPGPVVAQAPVVAASAEPAAPAVATQSAPGAGANGAAAPPTNGAAVGTGGH